VDYVRIFMALGLPALAGSSFTLWLLRGESRVGPLDCVILGAGLGLGFLTQVMFFMGILGAPYAIHTIAPALIVVAAVFIYLYLRSGKGRRDVPMTGDAPATSGPMGPWPCLTALLVLWVSLKLVFVFYESFNRPIYSWDAWANWSSGAKIFYYSRGIIPDAADEFFLGGAYRPFPGHPLHNPLLQAWVSLFVGSFHEVYAKAWSFFYYAGILAVLYRAVKRYAGRPWALAAVFGLASAPLLAYHGQDAYSDLPLAFNALAAGVCLWMYLSGNGRPLVVLSGLFAGMGVFVKNEGAFFVAAIAASLVAYTASGRASRLVQRPAPGPVRKVGPGAIRDVLYFILPALAAGGPWVVFKAYHGLGFGHTGAAMRWLSDPTFAGDAPAAVRWEVMGHALMGAFMSVNHGLIIPFWLTVTLLGLKGIITTELKYLWAVILAVAGMFAFVYVTLEPASVVQGTGVHRNILTYLPLMAFSSALVAARLWPWPGARLRRDGGA
jgi:4-amino-4-deoxy-L-arabinose transferase-like glycosyltransferase